MNATVANWIPIPVQLVSREQESLDVFTYRLQLPPSTPFNFQHGQFNMLYVPGAGESAISIAGYLPEENQLIHTIRSVGHVTRLLEDAELGSTIGVRGPFGSAWPVHQGFPFHHFQHIIFVAGGLGVVPLRTAIEEVIERRAPGAQVSILVGARNPAEFVYNDRISDWGLQGLDIHRSIDKPASQWHGKVGFVTTLLQDLVVTKPYATLVMSCGPEIMMRSVAEICMAKRIAPQNIYLSLERNMNCAVGHCGHCQFGPNFVCKDGPVQSYDRLAKYLRVKDV